MPDLIWVAIFAPRGGVGLFDGFCVEMKQNPIIGRLSNSDRESACMRDTPMPCRLDGAVWSSASPYASVRMQRSPLACLPPSDDMEEPAKGSHLVYWSPEGSQSARTYVSGVYRSA